MVDGLIPYLKKHKLINDFGWGLVLFFLSLLFYSDHLCETDVPNISDFSFTHF